MTEKENLSTRKSSSTHGEELITSNDEFKIHISRVPTKFNEDIVSRILKEHLQGDKETENEEASSDVDAITVELIYAREDEGATSHKRDDREAMEQEEKQETSTGQVQKEHRGFGFVTFTSNDLYEKALELQTIKGGRKRKSTKLYTMYLRPYATSEEDAKVCYLWTQNRCHYGDSCTFAHTGPGACVEVKANDTDKKKKGKCFAFKKGKCDKGDACPFSHDFEIKATASKESEKKLDIPKSEKDCISWKTKGKCGKGDSCPYRHDPELLKKVELKKKRKRAEKAENGDKPKQKQPLSIRVFGLAYDTTEQDVRDFFQDCGKIQTITFPTFDDSGRSKGYCGVWFSSPKAVAKAIELDGKELLGRWLSIQAGKMYLKQWEEHHNNSNKRSRTTEDAE